MKKEQILLFLLFISSTVFGQQHVEPYMIDMPRDTIRYVVNGEKRNVTIARYYISQYPESMRQYKEYLAEHDSLENLEATKRIYPNRVNLALCGLNDDEIDFIISEYFVEPQYDDYPIVGLDYQ